MSDYQLKQIISLSRQKVGNKTRRPWFELQR
jgi:hypothetical protein